MSTTCKIKEFLHLESAGGIILITVMLFAMMFANSPLSTAYDSFLHLPVQVRVGALDIAKPLILWINDGLMAIFFLLVGLELKREVLEGELSNPAQIVLPSIAAVGGMLVPALFFYAFNSNDAYAMNGWAIPTATDIAFALGILSLLGKRVPLALKLFLLTLAIIDDLGAIVVIALFYTTELSNMSLTIAGFTLSTLFLLNRLGVTRTAAYIIVGVILWVSVLKSGVHATLAGVALAFAIPNSSKKDRELSPLKNLEHTLHPWVTFMILPLFAFANAGVPIEAKSLAQLNSGVPLGIILGLFFGKQLGIFGFSFVCIKLGFVKMPHNATWVGLYGVATLAGIGFTMSLFIDSLAYETTPEAFLYADKLAIIIGSTLSAIVGFLILKFSKISQTEKLNKTS